jgi:hypothetical protein
MENRLELLREDNDKIRRERYEAIEISREAQRKV